MPRFHVLAIPHTVSSEEYLSCAFTQKVVKFCAMMKSGPNKNKNIIMHYGHERSKVMCDEHITVTNDHILKVAYGNYDWKRQLPPFATNDYASTTFYQNAIREIKARKQPGDFLLCFWGVGHKGVSEAFPDLIVVEPGIGNGTGGCLNAPNKVFESYAIMHTNYADWNIRNGIYSDSVIPNYFNPSDFLFLRKKQDYALFIGRIITAKGLNTMIALAKILRFNLVIAGQGKLSDMGWKPEDLAPNIYEVGYADLETRRQLMANAKLLFLPSRYIEPFGGTVVEAMLSGTPVITEDWGVFNETVLHGYVGYRCRSLDHYEFALKNVHRFDPAVCHKWALDNYSLDRVRAMYEEYFDYVYEQRRPDCPSGAGGGWYRRNPDRKEMDWLVRYHPSGSPISSESPAFNEPLQMAAEGKVPDVPPLIAELMKKNAVPVVTPRKEADSDPADTKVAAISKLLPLGPIIAQLQQIIAAPVANPNGGDDSKSQIFAIDKRIAEAMLEAVLEHTATDSVRLTGQNQITAHIEEIKDGDKADAKDEKVVKAAKAEEPEKKQRVCLVTAFINLNRGEWKSFQRGFDEYLKAFEPYAIDLPADEMIAFIDSTAFDQVSALCAKHKADKIKLIKIDRSFLAEKIKSWSVLAREREIMESSSYKALISRRIAHPEHHNPEYTTTTHSKVDFCAFAIEENLTSADIVAWTDFGYFKTADTVPPARSTLSPRLFPEGKVTTLLFADLDERDYDPEYTLVMAPTKFMAMFFGGSRKAMLEYRDLYHVALTEFHKLGYTDDEQHMMIRCYKQNASLFHKLIVGKWHCAYQHLCVARK